MFFQVHPHRCPGGGFLFTFSLYKSDATFATSLLKFSEYFLCRKQNERGSYSRKELTVITTLVNTCILFSIFYHNQGVEVATADFGIIGKFRGMEKPPQGAVL